MSMRILFTKSHLIGSRLIRWGLEEPVSHVAIEWQGLVFHANPKGVIIEPLMRFLDHSEIVYIAPVDIGDHQLRAALYRYWKSPYDWFSVAWLTVRSLFKKVGIRLPKANLWNSTNMFICHEWVTEVLGSEDPDTTPFQLYLSLTNKN